MYAGLSGSSTVLRTMPMSAASGSRPHSAGQPGALVDDWNKCVKHLTVSSRERQASRLYDRSLAGCWQSSGRQGHVSPPLSKLSVIMLKLSVACTSISL